MLGSSAANESEKLQRYAQPSADRFSNEGEPDCARAGASQNLERDAALRTDPEIEKGSTIIRSARWAAFCQRRRSHGHCAQQNPERFGREIADHAWQTGTVCSGLGLP